jgi:selT/selW/selH-like putative selenoprotein
LNAETDHEAEAEPGAKGQFDVLADGRLIFSKKETDRFPDEGEIRGLLA